MPSQVAPASTNPVVTSMWGVVTAPDKTKNNWFRFSCPFPVLATFIVGSDQKAFVSGETFPARMAVVDDGSTDHDGAKKFKVSPIPA